MANPQPSGNGETRGLGDVQRAGTPLPSRPQRAQANDARNPAHSTKPDTSHADGSLDPNKGGKS